MLVLRALLAFAGLALGATILEAATTQPTVICAYPRRFRVTPAAKTWRLDFAVFADRDINLTAHLAKVGGVDITAALWATAAALPVNVVPTPAGELARWSDLKQRAKLRSLSLAESEALAALQARIAEALTGGACAQLSIPVGALGLQPRSGDDYPVTIELRGSGYTIRFIAIAAVRSLPDDPDWSPADLHIHSSASDGRRDVSELVGPLQDMGYRIAYFTDHVDRVRKRYPDWSRYAEHVTGATAANPNIRFYPGNELTVVNGAGKAQGDLLAYGVSSFRGLETMRHSPQAGIDAVITNNPLGPSSASIAHPFRIPAWTDWSATRYRGYELMSGPSVAGYSDTAEATERWRTELSEQTETPWFASARVGSDWHQTVFDAEHPGYVTWLNTGQWHSQAAVDAALHAGRTVASRRGSLGYMTLACGGAVAGIGGRLTGLLTGEPVLFRITFKPIASGRYYVAVCTDDKTQRVFESGAVWCDALQTYSLTGSFAAARGSHYYYLFICTRGDRLGDEYVYSSPIFVSAE